jgi:hypothetical protein
MEWLPPGAAVITLLLFVLIPASAAVGAHWLFRRIVPSKRLIPHQEVAGFLVAVVGVLYAVVLGFIVVTTWSAYDTAQVNADLEAGDVGDAFGFAHMLPEPRRSDLRKILAEYAIRVRDREFISLQHGREDRRARDLLLAAEQTLGEPVPTPSRDIDEALNRATTRDVVAASLRDIADQRRLRLIEATSMLHPALYLALLLGALMVIAFVFLFGVESQPLQLAMTGIVAGCIGLLIGVVVVFSAPYSGPMRVSSDTWTYVINNNDFPSIVEGTRR